MYHCNWLYALSCARLCFLGAAILLIGWGLLAMLIGDAAASSSAPLA